MRCHFLTSAVRCYRHGWGNVDNETQDPAMTPKRTVMGHGLLKMFGGGADTKPSSIRRLRQESWKVRARTSLEILKTEKH